ncbi:Putative Mediator of RNA polymerase II transcription subunit 8 [Podospora comata]|uniref:Mediator of RNA polymerase II transcription subunit 8 n=1 Tax=Podospora comata TaxID=48703 RepID=A0ABY6RU96_PODCO|nr:Putative Mediator of RNA polymerase II transcription subunit 8 [Podospora comata]
MASLNLLPEDLKHLDLLRNRFATLSLNLSNAHRNMALTYPLPSQESLQASAAIIHSSLLSLQSILTDKSALFHRIAVHPSTNFPGRTQLDFLSSMLRKKPEPEIETKMEMGMQRAREVGVDEAVLAEIARRNKRREGGDDEDYEEGGGGGGGDGDEGEDEEANNEKWADCWFLFDRGLKEYINVQEGRSYTVEEQEMGVESVRTGLRRNFGNTGVQPEHLFWLYARGRTDLPPRIELESKRAPAKGQVKRLPPR